MSSTLELIAIGKVVGVFGISGEMKIASMTHSIDRFTQGLSILIGPGDTTKEYRSIQSVRMKAPHLLIRLEGITTRTEAEHYVGHFLFVDRDHRIQLPPRTWFISDIIGMVVTDDQGAEIGTVTDVLTLPAHHVYVVQQGDHEILIPAIPDVVLDVDIEHKKIIIHMPDGLLEL
jgi:16S rRNA processing protein RimM